jgi:hypothetical protein
MTKEMITKEQKQEIKRILDDILPVQSSKNYRYQEITDGELYNTYKSEVVNGNSVSKSCFIYLVVAKEKLKHLQARKFCLLCK